MFPFIIIISSHHNLSLMEAQLQTDKPYQHYFHQQYLPSSSRKLCRSYKHNNLTNNFILVNSNKLQLYAFLNTTITYKQTIPFMCNIKVFQILPSKHHQTDYIFIADDIGRYQIYHQEQGIIYSSDKIDITSIPQSLTFDHDEINKLQYSGITYVFSVYDTEGYIMYTYSKMLVVINFSIKKSGLIVNKVSSTQIMLNSFRYAGVLSSNKNKHLIGFIQQFQQKTTFRVVSMQKPLKQQWNIQKINLLQFVSSGNQIALMTYNEVSIYSYLSNQPICNFRIHETWTSQLCVLDNQTFLHFGEQIVVFGKKGIRNYGSIKLQENNDSKQFNQCRLIAQNKSNFSIFISKNNRNSYIINIGQQGWEILKQFKSLSNIFTMSFDQNTKNMFTVSQIGDQLFEANKVNGKYGCILQRNQQVSTIIDSIINVLDGKIILLNTHNNVVILRYNQMLQLYEKCSIIENQWIYCATSQYIILMNGIYGINYMTMEKIIKIKEQIKEAMKSGDEKYIGILNQKGEFKIYQTQNQKLVSHRINCNNQFIWQIYNNILYTVNWTQKGTLKLFPINLNNKQQKKYILNQKQIISDIKIHKFNQYDYLFVGFGNGTLNILLPQQGKIIQTISLNRYKPLNFFPCFKHLLIQCGEWNILNYKNNSFQISAIDLPINSILTYCKNISKIILSQQNSLYLAQLPNIQHPLDTSLSHFEVVDKDAPFIITFEDLVYLVTIYQLRIYHCRSKVLLKKQIHILKDVRFAQYLLNGLLIVGIDDMDQGRAVLFSWGELQIIFSLNFGNKHIPSCVKRYKTNQFILRFENSISLYEINQNQEAKQISSFFTNHSGYALDVNEKQNKIVINDPLSYIIIYDLNQKSFLPVARHYRPYKIVDVAFIDNSLIYADRAGYFGILQFNFQHTNDIQKLKMSQVACLNLSDQIFTFTRDSKNIYYGCRSGLIGRITSISSIEYKILKKAQNQVQNQQSKLQGLKYDKWRRRAIKDNDKLIDEVLINLYIKNKLQFKQKNPEFYQQVKKIYEKLTKN